MANDVRPGEILATVPVKGIRAPTTATDASGKIKPQVNAGGKLPPHIPVPAVPAAKSPEQSKPPEEKTGTQADLAALAERVGQHLRESGRAISFRVSNSSGRTVIHEINPDTGEVIAEITSDNLMSLARGLGFSGELVNSHA
jgi:uncharacterized FlaG/YvyC family protein